MEWLFWACAGCVAYVYLGYPALVWLVSRAMGSDTKPSDIEPTVVVLIAAHNEVADIERTVRNKLEQDYPAEKLSVVVVSDASDDGTDAVVAGLGPRVRLLRQEPRAGKTAALNMAAEQVDAEILVFADANSLYDPDAVRRIVRHFADPRVGYVTGKMVYTNPDGTLIGDGCSAYMKYENFLRVEESRLASVIGVDGGIDAMRRALYIPLRADQQPDFVLPLIVAGKGLRVVYEARAILKEPALGDHDSEYQMRVRVSLRAMWALWDQRRLLVPVPHALLAWQIWSHKVLRYMAFIPALVAFVVCLALARSEPLYLAIAAVAIVLIALAAVPWLRGGRGKPWMMLPYYVLLLNVTAAHAFLKLLSGKKQTLWAPRTG
jgi:cellulose synthase/poly-beta-1,6-N-acetylglucosamine synthase-like glycosyltransferase